jgi:hypothetical protein
MVDWRRLDWRGVTPHPETTGPLASWRCKWSCAQQARVGPLDPDVLLGDGAVAPLRHSHHLATVLELADHAGPVS